MTSFSVFNFCPVRRWLLLMMKVLNLAVGKDSNSTKIVLRISVYTIRKIKATITKYIVFMF